MFEQHALYNLKFEKHVRGELTGVEEGVNGPHQRRIETLCSVRVDSDAEIPFDVRQLYGRNFELNMGFKVFARSFASIWFHTIMCLPVSGLMSTSDVVTSARVTLTFSPSICSHSATRPTLAARTLSCRLLKSQTKRSPFSRTSSTTARDVEGGMTVRDFPACKKSVHRFTQEHGLTSGDSSVTRLKDACLFSKECREESVL